MSLIVAYLCPRQSIWGESAHFHAATRNAQYRHGPERRHVAAGMHRGWPVSRRKWTNGSLLGQRMTNVHLAVLFQGSRVQIASKDLHRQFKCLTLYCVFQSNARYLLEQGERGPAKRPFFISQFPENSEDNRGDRSGWGRLPLFSQESPGEQPSHHHCSGQRSVTGCLFICHISKILFSHIIH